MKKIETNLSGVYILEPKIFKDNRGFFQESYNHSTFEELNLNYHFIQDNHSLSIEPNIIRGLHYQLHPKAQTKVIRVLTGAIFDVVVDIRRSSPTFGKWISVILSEENQLQLLIPKGFAHGFCTLKPNTNILYKVDEYYSPIHDKGIRWDDPEISITWPTSNPILSPKDAELPFLQNAEINF